MEITPAATAIAREWVRDGEFQLTVLGEDEIEILATGQMALWCPTVFEGAVSVRFDAMVPAGGTKLLVLVHGHGVAGDPVRGWARDGVYDDYNAGRMEVYTIAVNRGAHISGKPGDQLANCRRIGGPEFAVYTAANFRRRAEIDTSFWDEWNTRSLLGAALEPENGPGAYRRHEVTVAPPHIRLAVNGIAFAEMVDHRANPLRRGAIGFRCMTRGKTFRLRNISIEGVPAAGEVC